MKNQLEEIFFKLEEYSESSNFKGYDPYDALNSPLLKTLTFGNRFLGILFLQLLKRSPVNLRSVLLIKKGINPKGFGIFISAYVGRYKLLNNKKDLDQAKKFATWLIQNYSEGYSGYCWGYNFDWPNRNSFFPKGLPTIVNTAFIANGFLITPKGSHISASILTFPFKNPKGIIVSQIVQESRDFLLVKIVPNRLFTKQEEIKLKEDISSCIGNEMRIEIRRVEEIPHNKNGKFRLVLSKVPFEL